MTEDEQAMMRRPQSTYGSAVDLTSHRNGTARAFRVNPLAGTFAGIAVSLNGLLIALLAPLLLWRSD